MGGPGAFNEVCKPMSTNRGRPTAAHDRDRRKAFELLNSRVVVEHGPAGTLARVERGRRTEYAGPFDDPDAIIDALEEATDG